MKPLNRYFDAIARPSLERYGFAYAELLRNWPAIAPDAAAFARPESLHFPRRAGKGKGMNFATAVRPAPIDAEHAIPAIHDMITYLREHPGCTKEQIPTRW